MDESFDPGANMEKVLEENTKLRGKIEGYKSMENLLRRKVEEVSILKGQLSQRENLQRPTRVSSCVLNPLISEPGLVEIDKSSVEIQHSSEHSQQLCTRSEESSAFSLELGFPFQARPTPTSTSLEVKKIRTCQTGVEKELSSTNVTSNQHKNMEASEPVEVSCGDNQRLTADSMVLDSGNQAFSSTADSLGPQIITMANKVRYLEKKLKLTVKEKDALSDRLNELMAAKVGVRGMEPLNYANERLDGASYNHTTTVKDSETSNVFAGPGVDVIQPDQVLINFDGPVRVENTGTCNVKTDRNVNTTGFTEDEFNKLKLKCHKQEQEYREKLEHERACKEKVSRQLEIEKMKKQQLKEYLKELRSDQRMHHTGGADAGRSLVDKNNCREKYSRDEQQGDDKVVPDLLMEISVLHQQMVVVVEDFEKERSDRARAMSARDTLKKNFDSLAEKVKVLKRQLVAAHANLTWQISRNASLAAEISKLHTVLSETNQRKIHTAPVASRRTHNMARRPDITAEFLNYWQNSNTNAPREAEIAVMSPHSHSAWSCNACTFQNPAQRTICEICGTVNGPNNSSSSVMRTAPCGDYPGNVHPIERTCRLVSRGLSTDETVTGHLDDEIDIGDTNRSYSM